MFEHFRSDALEAIDLTKKESFRLGHNFVGTEHILLGLIGQDTGMAARVLKSMGVSAIDAYWEVQKIIGIGHGSGLVGSTVQKLITGSSEIQFTPRTKKAFDLSRKSAEKFGHDYIDTGHLLLGILYEGEGAAVRVIQNLSVSLEDLRCQLEKELKGP